MQRNRAGSFPHICLAAQVNQAYLGKPGVLQSAERRASFMHWNSVSLAGRLFICLPKFTGSVNRIIAQIDICGSPLFALFCGPITAWNLKPRGQHNAQTHRLTLNLKYPLKRERDWTEMCLNTEIYLQKTSIVWTVLNPIFMCLPTQCC